MSQQEIIREPIFELYYAEWGLKSSGCPLCKTGMLNELSDIIDIDKNRISYAACDTCHCAVYWQPIGESPEWRVLQ